MKRKPKTRNPSNPCGPAQTSPAPSLFPQLSPTHSLLRPTSRPVSLPARPHLRQPFSRTAWPTPACGLAPHARARGLSLPGLLPPHAARSAHYRLTRSSALARPRFTPLTARARWQLRLPRSRNAWPRSPATISPAFHPGHARPGYHRRPTNSTPRPHLEAYLATASSRKP